MRILVTGSCGFIGYHLCKRLIKDTHEVTGIDNFNDYYDVTIKEDRCRELELENIEIVREDLSSPDSYLALPDVDIIIHLAAQAGVRYSLQNPYSYIKNNIIAFGKLIDYARLIRVKKFIYASSSSVYGTNMIPWKEDMDLGSPLSLYGATKISNEVIANEYRMFGLNSIGLRFFTVYGPFGRPDMALWKWANSMLTNKSVELYNHGKMDRSFTYIDDIVSGIISSMYLDFEGHEIFNLGNDNMINIEYAVDYMYKYLKIKPKKKYLKLQPGDVEQTSPDLTKSKQLLNFNPETKFEEGVIKFIEWFKEYHKL